MNRLEAEPTTKAPGDPEDERTAASTGSPFPGDPTFRTTRREFLAYSSAGVVAVSLPLSREQAAPPATPAARGPGSIEITLRVNGSHRRVTVNPADTLAHALRDHLSLTGTKIGCDRGACSACTVLLDGTPVSACMTFALDVGDREVTTIEGLAHGRALHRVQEAFVAADAMQCGFCTPGMIMSCVALLARTPHPTLEQVRAATSGNLCRCGTYPRIFAAVLSAGGSPLTSL